MRNFKGDKEGKETNKDTTDPEKGKLVDEEKKVKDAEKSRDDINTSMLSSHNNSGFDVTNKKIQ